MHALATLLFVVVSSDFGVAHAACADVTITAGASATIADSFDPLGSDVIQAAQMTLTNAGAGDCTGAVAFERSSPPMVLLSGANQLEFELEDTSGSDITFDGSPPGSGNRIDVVIPANNAVVIDYRIRAQKRAGMDTEEIST